ncbi:hypothetical protein ACPUVO_17605 [Pseudocolwellia sp. HL-MZ19]|uniref:hypothetical protein n=1 Tax=Pseudocolwellia sp. HL-MZ19 TaxID=3400846 RepID=UPI003CF2A8FF
MKRHRMGVGRSIVGKVSELGFFLQKIIDLSKLIEEKHKLQDYPLNIEIDELNYYFSAFMNIFQSLKDACKISMEVDFSWKSMSPSYGEFLFYCRNAVTHDGRHLINSGHGHKNYITGPLCRIDGRGNSVTHTPPTEDVCSISCNMSKEVLASISTLVKKDGNNIPVPEEADFIKSYEESLQGNFYPPEIIQMKRDNRVEIINSFKNIKIDIVQEILISIKKVEDIIVCT